MATLLVRAAARHANEAFRDALRPNRALLYTVLTRLWSVAAGPVSIIFIARFLSKEEQGYYYTIWSILGLWIFFDLGLSIVLVQFASHERASFTRIQPTIEGAVLAKRRLSSVLHFAVQWSLSAGSLMLLVLIPAGILFFQRYGDPHPAVHWFLPWLLVVSTGAINIQIGPLAGILEGSGLLRDVALMRLLQQVLANGALWIALVAGGGLYSAVVMNTTILVVTTSWMTLRHGRFFRDLWRTPTSENVTWRSEIWPFQWRFATSWIANYFMFQVFTPIAFAARGAEAAGRVGISVMVSTTIGVFAQSWVTTRAVDFGALIAANDRARLERSFRLAVVQSTAVLIVLSSLVLAGLAALLRFNHPFSDRVLGLLPMSLLLVATILNHVLVCEGAYLRAQKREPLFAVSIATGVIAAGGALLVGRHFGIEGMMVVLCVAVAIGVGGGSVVFVRRRNEWLASAQSQGDENVVV